MGVFVRLSEEVSGEREVRLHLVGILSGLEGYSMSALGRKTVAFC